MGNTIEISQLNFVAILRMDIPMLPNLSDMGTPTIVCPESSVFSSDVNKRKNYN
jgi:hypothetical protein